MTDEARQVESVESVDLGADQETAADARWDRIAERASLREKREKRIWASRIRRAVILSMLGVTAFAVHGGLVSYFPGLYTMFLVIFLVNEFAAYRYRRARKLDETSAFMLTADMVGITLFVYFTGGVLSFVIPIYFMQVAGGSTLANWKMSRLRVLLGCLLFTALVVGEFLDLIPHRELQATDGDLLHNPVYLTVTIITVIIIMYLVAYTTGKVAEDLKICEGQLECANRELDRLYLKNREMARRDGLTELYNRRYFMDRLDAEFRRAERYRHPLSLAIFDVDHFKRCNDTQGHQVGDRVLRGIADILLTNLRQTDLPARYGGEEFAVLLPETGAVEAKRLTERIREAIENHDFSGRDGSLKITASAGVATLPGDGITGLEGLVSVADGHLYRAKEGGRNRVCASI